MGLFPIYINTFYALNNFIFILLFRIHQEVYFVQVSSSSAVTMGGVHGTWAVAVGGVS